MKHSIATKLILWLLLITIVPLAAVGYLIYINAEKHLTLDIERQLFETAEDKGRRIETYFVERRRDAMALARSPLIIDAFRELNRASKSAGPDSRPDKPAHNLIKLYLSYYKDTYGYQNLHLVSREGVMVFSDAGDGYLGLNLKAGPRDDFALAKVIDKANTLMQAEISGFGDDRISPTPAVYVAAPVFDDGTLVGTVVFQLSNRELYRLIEDYRDLGATGETVVGQRIQQEVVVVAPLRHDPEAAFRRRFALGSAVGQTIQQAAQGRKGQGLITDYRGERAVAAWSYLPNAGWGLVVKIDAAEVYAPIRRLRNLSLAIEAAIILVVTAITLLVSKSFSHPIKELTRTAEFIARGHLTERARTTSKDEIGQLAETFNSMATQVQERTVALEKAVQELHRHKGNLEAIVQERTQELQSKEEYYRSLIEKSSDIIAVLNPDASVRYASPSIERVLGYRPDDLTGKIGFDYVHPDDLPTVIKFLEDRLEQPGVAEPIEVRCRHRDGSWRHLEAGANSQIGNPAVKGIVLNSRDITERKIADQKLADFTAMIVHDLRSPLSNIIGIAGMMAEGLFGAVNEEQKKWAERIKNNATSLVTLISDFLDVSKLEAGHIELSRQTTDLENLIRSAVEGYLPMATGKTISLTSRSDPGLPRIHADPRRLDQVLNNLLSNALKFTEPGGTVEVRAFPNDGAGVCVQVRDSGVGIAREEITGLFEKYRQTASGKTSEHKGTGLGLVICKMIVEAHGGNISVESEPGNGTTFTVTLPPEN